MWRLNRKKIAAILAVIAVLIGVGMLARRAPADEPRGATQLDLTSENWAKLHALIRPHEHEWRHLKVQWLTDVVAARKKAAAEDKPIVICYSGGAGYNEPLGVC
jgi:hypothetical protein